MQFVTDMSNISETIVSRLDKGNQRTMKKHPFFTDENLRTILLYNILMLSKMRPGHISAHAACLLLLLRPWDGDLDTYENISIVF